MSKLMTRLEKLNYFTSKNDEFRKRAEALQAEMQNADKEFNAWLETDLGVKGQLHLSDVIKKALETSYEPRIIAPN